jgi:glutamyl-Q tRNA(Asp) synthetase
VRRQSEHFDNYAGALARLDAMGLLYPSFESRAEIAHLVAAREALGPWPRDPDGVALYPGDAKARPRAERERRIGRGDVYALRLDMAAALALAARRRTSPLTFTETGARAGAQAAVAAAWGDVVLARKDTPASYHLCVVLDDALQGITHVVRGEDLFAATGLHRLLQWLLGLPEPVYHHHRLVRDADGRKLSKSSSATGLAALRAAGATPSEIRRLTCFAGPPQLAV